MSARGFGYASIAIACIVLAACGDSANGAKTEQSSAERLSAAMDICAQTRNAFAQNVCANETLAALDSQVVAALVTEASDVSDAGAELLVQNQARWREAARISCGLRQAGAAPTDDQQGCLAGEYRARLSQVAGSVEVLGGYTFQRMELVEAAPVSAEMVEGMGEDAPHAVLRQILFPRIDGRQTRETQRFNDLVAQRPQATLSEGVTERVNYSFGYAGPELISVRFDISQEDVRGTASVSLRAVTVMMGEGRLLTESDVFRPDSGWQDYLTRRAVAELTREFADYGFTPPVRDVRESVTEPHLWLITEAGLTLLFTPYAIGGPHSLGDAVITIPWADLRQYLNPAAPTPIRAVA